ncbi:hypothetical protein WJX74_000826 [Apatococcus lobatus]|uniref:Jacalin-type lectin domain-containing protein n=1 Tax=Apatococcus lobatus TaxID=904363 RepID=A0AAW1QXM8_9CHLO
MTQQTDDFELVAPTNEEGSGGATDRLHSELAAARKRISELESLTQQSAEDSQRELAESKLSLEQAIASIAKLTASESQRMCKCNSPLIGGPGGSPFQLTSISNRPSQRVERITCWSQPSGKDEIRAIEVEFEDGHTALAGRRIADATVQESFSFMDDELLLQSTLIADAKDTRLAGFSFITSLGRAFHAGPGTVTSGHAVTWLQDCPAILLGISGSGGAAIDRLAFIIQVCGRP